MMIRISPVSGVTRDTDSQTGETATMRTCGVSSTVLSANLDGVACMNVCSNKTKDVENMNINICVFERITPEMTKTHAYSEGGDTYDRIPCHWHCVGVGHFCIALRYKHV